MNSPVSIEQLLQSAFQLAYFIHGVVPTAIEITIEAMDKLEMASEAQDKRLYYKPIGRLASRGARTRVSLNKKHLLQRLVYIESERYEKATEERPESQSQQRFLIHFIKHLVRIIMKRNSFYVALGISRLLYNYTTAETMEIYNFLVQDPDRIREDTYYRMRKMQLMQEMKKRFGNRLRTRTNSRREERFQAQEISEEYLLLSRNCLLQFSPWDTPCMLPEQFDSFNKTVNGLLFQGEDPDDEHVIETNRIHTVLHPDCYRRLTKLLRLDLPERRLEVPLFFIADHSGPRSGEQADPPELGEKEVEHMKEILTDRAKRRKKSSGKLLSVFVDGQQQAQIRLPQISPVRFAIEDGAEIIEIRRADKRGELSIAFHLLEYNQAGIKAAHHSIPLPGGQRVILDIPEVKSFVEQSPQSLVTIAYEEASLLRFVSLAVRRLAVSMKERLREPGWGILNFVKSPLALTLITCAVLFAVFLRIKTPTIEQLEAEAPQKVTGPENRNSNSQVQPPENQDGSANQSTSPSTPATGKNNGRKTATDEKSVTDSQHLRALGPEEAGASLKTVKHIYIDLLGADEVSQEVRNLLNEALQASTRFTLTHQREQADAVLTGVVKTTLKNKGELTLRLQLINARGEIIWQVSPKRLHTGQASQIVTRVVTDLLKDAER